MIPAAFDYEAPASVDEALQLLAGAGDREVKVLAGGQSLLPVLNFRLAQPAVLWRSPEETSAPPAIVPLKVDTPGMAPSYPMSLVPLGALASVI